MNQRQLFNDGWSFSKQEIGTSYQTMQTETVNWMKIDLPHDWLIYHTNNLYETSEGWYKKSFPMTAEELTKCILLQFEGVYMDSTIYVNGAIVGEWKYGYSSFEFDITKYLMEGNNEVMVRVVHQSPNSRWYSGAGIYRNVWFKVCEKPHIKTNGVYIAAKKQENGYLIKLDTELAGLKEGNFALRYRIYNPSNVQVSEPVIALHRVHGTEKECVIKKELFLEAPILWDISSPNLYTLEASLIMQGTEDIILHNEKFKFGLREVMFDTENGFFLNGIHHKLNGVCLHHDLGCLGAAVNKAAIKRQFELLKKMGVNAIRTSHNMPAVDFMDLADEFGMLIVSEGFDMWERPKTEYDYARFFKEWVEKDVESWIRRDRNHPSVILWSIGNEIYDTHADEHGQDITRRLMKDVEQHDYYHNAPVTIGSNFMPWENAKKCADLVKVAGYNYAEGYYEEHHKEHPDWFIYGSETASTVQSRGIYHFPFSQSVLCDDDEQCSSLGNSQTSWGAKSTESCIIDDRDAKFSLGQFIWTGWDYIGEPTPYHTKSSYFGQIDTAGFPKDSFYIYQAEWTDYREAPMVHILPYWDFNENQLIDVRVASNAPKIELFFNGESIGSYEIDHEKGKKLLGHWCIPYNKGTLKAYAYDYEGNVIATDMVTSFGDAVELVLTPNKKQLKADGEDLIFLEISMKDEEGHPVLNANNRVEVLVTGAGRLLGLDNGDSTDYDSYKGTSRRLFSGKLLAVIGAKTQAGEIKVEVTSNGLISKTIYLEAEPSTVREGVSCQMENERSADYSMDTSMRAKQEVPIRKIVLTTMGSNHLNETQREVVVKAKLLPENTSYQDILWRLTTATGADTNIAALKVLPDGVRITALGDGEFYLRAMTKNGGNRIALISMLDFKATGLGEANLNPYEFVSASLFYDKRGALTNGNERGMATARDGVSMIGFERVDFGEFGSDEITLPIFELGSNMVEIELWEGVPRETGSRKIDTLRYQKESIWNVFQEETYQLPERLTGMKTLWFLVDNHKIHLKGFSFTKKNKAYEKLYAIENTNIYGDTYNLREIKASSNKEIDHQGKVVENIGNNVSILFEDMDFMEGISKIKLCGHSPIDKNTIQICFTDEAGTEVKQLCEFTYSEDYVTKEFKLNNITGKQKVTFIFLPGCQFDFFWFMFEK